MLSPLFPAWLIPTLSPVFTMISKAIPSAYRGIALLLVCLVVTAGVVAISPLVPDDIVPQAVILFGIVTAGYTLTKPIEGASPAVVTGALVGLVAFGGASYAIAQEAGVSGGGAMIVPQMVLALVNGIVGRLFKRWGWRF